MVEKPATIFGTKHKKKKMNVEELERNNMLAYKFLRGSWSHGIGIEGKSDYDYGGVYIAPLDVILGLRSNYQEQVSDAKSDKTYYEFGRWIELLLKSNPTALESLYVDKKFIIGDIHPAIQHIIDNRDYFLCKECFKPLIGYSVAQIKKATGYNKKCNIPEDFKRKDILDFCFVADKQGSKPVKDFLKEHHLDQKYCGLVNIPNMPHTYGVYYDWAAYFHFENIDQAGRVAILNSFRVSPGATDDMFMYDILGEGVDDRIANKKFFHYGGIVHPDDNERSNTVRLSSIPKGEQPICTMVYNKDAYVCHCHDYKEWDEWKKKRNQIRYSGNKGYNFDAKNMCETVRLIHTGIELARDGEFNVERTWDRDFLLNIKNHKVSYDEISKYIAEKKEEFDRLVEKSTLPEKLDYEKINNLLIETRKMLYGIA